MLKNKKTKKGRKERKKRRALNAACEQATNAYRLHQSELPEMKLQAVRRNKQSRLNRITASRSISTTPVRDPFLIGGKGTAKK